MRKIDVKFLEEDSVPGSLSRPDNLFKRSLVSGVITRQKLSDRENKP